MRGDVRQGAHERQQAVLSQLSQFEADGRIPEPTHNTLGKCVRISEADIDSRASVEPALTKVEEFEAWAEQNDRSLQPAFERREVSSVIIGGIRL